MKEPIVLIIRDGWGVNKNKEYNAVSSANTPNVSEYLAKYPNTILEASGEPVGLPRGYQGSSEVGHLNIGAGRIVKQEITRINEAIDDGSFFTNINFSNAISSTFKNESALHLMGLIQDEGVHAHQDHLFSIMKYCKKLGVKRLYIHFFTDGRDTPPRSAMQYLNILNEKIKELKIGQIATVMGRYYSMDRGNNWNLTTLAYDAITKAIGRNAPNAQDAILSAYKKDKCPDGSEIMDEYILPTIIGNYQGVKDGDSVIHLNYRQDRAKQLTRAFIDVEYPGDRWKLFNIVYCGLTRYYDSFKFNIIDAIDESKGMTKLLGEVISSEGYRQLRISETQKFNHVTSFFNGKRVEPYLKEDRIEIHSVFDPSSYAHHPEMSAKEVALEVIRKIEESVYKLIVVNFANCDMVGHTGNFNAAVSAVECVDSCVGMVVNSTLKQDGIALVTSDHGNAEEMVDLKTGLPKTSHTTNPVEFILISNKLKKLQLKPKGKLSDISPTILKLLNIEIPSEMTSEVLFYD